MLSLLFKQEAQSAKSKSVSNLNPISFCNLAALCVVERSARMSKDSLSSFTLELHTNSDDQRPVYVVGNFNRWHVADEEYKMQALGPGHFRLEIHQKELPAVLEYKYARGTWDYVELYDNGQERPNRKVSKTKKHSVDRVSKWRTDQFRFRSDLLPKIELIEEEDFDIPGSIRTRRIAALLPHDYYQSNKHYPVLYLQDGQNLYDDYAPYGNWAVDKRLAQLQEQGQGDVIIIAIDHAMDKRIVEYTPHEKTKLGKGEGRQYIRFLADVLKPYVDQRFRTKSDWANTGIGGSSMGGLISIYAGLMYPKTYGRLMIFSPSLWVTPRIRFQLLNLKQPYEGRVYLYGGNKESETMIPNLQRLQKALEDQDATTQPEFHISIDPQGKHSEAHWSKEFPKALTWLFHNKPSKKNSKHNGMKLQFSPKTPQAASLTLIPIEKKNGQADPQSIQALAEHYGLNAPYINRHFTADSSSSLALFSEQGDVLLWGLGEAPDFAAVLKSFRKFSIQKKDLFEKDLSLNLQYCSSFKTNQQLLEAAANGLWQGTYNAHHLKTSTAKPHPFVQEDFSLQFVVDNDHITSSEQAVARGLAIADAQCEIMSLVNAPANYKTAQHLAEWAQKSAKKYGYQCDVWNKQRIQEANMGGLLAVNQGSSEEPAFIVLEYKGKNSKAAPKFGLVGKGVTFDTGGLSIKPSNNMHYMKSDMGGAAAVLGTMEAVARLELPIHLVAVVPATDNAVDATAVKPGDVITSHSGKTIEIIDTDAEGRLILADGLSYITQEHKPDILIDLATLTGSSVRALGYQAGALFSNDKQLAQLLEKSGMQYGERLWELPLWDEYATALKSDVADIKNFTGQPTAGAITAAKFLENFTHEHPSWAHLDIAGVAFGETDYSKGKAATAYGVRLLIGFIEHILERG